MHFWKERQEKFREYSIKEREYSSVYCGILTEHFQKLAARDH